VVISVFVGFVYTLCTKSVKMLQTEMSIRVIIVCAIYGCMVVCLDLEIVFFVLFTLYAASVVPVEVCIEMIL
jgi:hypothetical protein